MSQIASISSISQKFKALRPILLSPPVVMLGISLILMLISLVMTHRVRAYNSDDVSWQAMLLFWRPFDGSDVVLGSSDNMVLKLPFFMLMEEIFPAGRKLLFLESAILAAAGFTMFYTASLYFLKKAKITLTYKNLLPFAWLASFGYTMAQLYLNPIWRGLEMGFIFLTFMVVAMVYYGDVKPLKSTASKIVTLLVAMFAGVIIYSDPYYAYFALAPIALFSLALVWSKKIAFSRILVVFGGMVVAFITSKLTGMLVLSAGIRMITDYPVELVDFQGFFTNASLALHGLLVIFGADFFGQKPASLMVIGAVINLFLIGAIVAGLSRASKTIQEFKKSPTITPAMWTFFFGALIIVSIALYVFSTVSVNDLRTYRYFIVVAFTAPLFLALIMSSLGRRLRTLVVVFLVLAISINTLLSLTSNRRYVTPQTIETSSIGWPGAEGNPSNSKNIDIISLIEGKGYKKGYANFWHGVINTYLSRGHVEFLPSGCGDGMTMQHHWLVDTSRFDIPADKSFYVFDPQLPQPASCTYEQLMKQFGTPAESVRLNGLQVFFYDYDISTKMP